MEKPASYSKLGLGHSCNACRRRKIRCDRGQPCSYCTKFRLPCTYASAPQGGKRQSEIDLLSRLERIETSLQNLEARVTDRSGQPPSKPLSVDNSPNHVRVPAPEAYPTSNQESGKLFFEEGGARYVTGSIWTDLDEGDTHETAVSDRPSATPDSIPTNTVFGPRHYQGFVFGLGSTSQALWQLHPEQNRFFSLWQTFLDNVDPVLKIIHVPTTQRRIQRASQNITDVPSAFEALMFSIYYAAVTSIQCSASCETIFHEERQTLLARYRCGVEQALTKANFISSPNIPTLQALTLYLICARQSIDKQYVWSMTGLLIRLAMKLGLHRDPVAFGLPPFLSEMRRRLWWQICILDVRVAEDNDTDPFICEQSFDTKHPAHLNDVDLDINMTQPPSETRQCSEMLFSLTRFEVSYAARKLVFSPKFAADNGCPALSLAEKNDLIESVLKDLQEKYLRHCDPNIPICFLAATATRMVLAKIKLTIHHPARNGPSGATQDQLTDLAWNSIEIIEYAHSLRSNDKYSRWAWLFQKYIEWDAVAFLLHTLSVVPASIFFEKAWNVIDTFFEDWKDHVVDRERWRRLEGLRTKARAKQNPKNLSRALQPDTLLATQTAEENPTENPPNISLGQPISYFEFMHSKSREPGNRLRFPEASGSVEFEDYIDWNFDNLPYIQETQSWEKDIDINALNS